MQIAISCYNEFLPFKHGFASSSASLPPSVATKKMRMKFEQKIDAAKESADKMHLFRQTRPFLVVDQSILDRSNFRQHVRTSI
jgi:hypothetical protein